MISNLGYYLRRLWWIFFAPGTRLTTCLVLSNIGIFILELYWSYHYHSDWLLDTFSLGNDWYFRHHYWQIVTYAWLHATSLPNPLIFHLNRLPLHLAVNMVMVFILGRGIESYLGPLRFAILYLGGCVAAAMAWLAFNTLGHEASMIGASGAAFALLTAMAIIEPDRVISALIIFIFPLKLTIRRLAILLVVSEAIMLHLDYTPEISHVAHLGGAFFGWALMKVWRIRPGIGYPTNGPVTRL